MRKRPRRTCEDRSRYARIQSLRQWRDRLDRCDNQGRAFRIATEDASGSMTSGGMSRTSITLTARDGSTIGGYEYDSVEAIQYAGRRLYAYLIQKERRTNGSE